MSNLMRILAKDTVVGQSYLSRAGREVTVKSKQPDGKILVLVHLTGNTVVIPPDYELFSEQQSNDPNPPETIQSSNSLFERTEEHVVDNQEVKDSEHPEENSTAPTVVSTSGEGTKPASSKSKLTTLLKEAPTVKDAVKIVLDTGDSYSVEEIAKLVGASRNTVMLKISELRRIDKLNIIRQNKKYRVLK